MSFRPCLRTVQPVLSWPMLRGPHCQGSHGGHDRLPGAGGMEQFYGRTRSFARGSRFHSRHVKSKSRRGARTGHDKAAGGRLDGRPGGGFARGDRRLRAAPTQRA